MFMRASKKIKAAMIFADITGTDIARKLHIGRSAVNHVINGRNRTPVIRTTISRMVGIPDDVWKEMDRELSSLKEAP